MNKWIFLAYSATFVVGIMGCSMSRPGPKIGYVDTTKLVTGFIETQRAQKAFAMFQKEWEENLKRLTDSATVAKMRMKLTYDTASIARKNALQDTAFERNQELQNYFNDVKKISTDKEKELMDPVVAKIDSFTEVWGKQHGYTLILGTTPQGNILQADSSLNVTNRLLLDLNAHFSEK